MHRIGRPAGEQPVLPMILTRLWLNDAGAVLQPVRSALPELATPGTFPWSSGNLQPRVRFGPDSRIFLRPVLDATGTTESTSCAGRGAPIQARGGARRDPAG